MPAGYRFLPQSTDVAGAVLAALICDIELFWKAHCRSSFEPETQIDPLCKAVFLLLWKEESQHAILDEMEWLREDDKLDAQQRDQAVDHLIGLVSAVDGIVQMQAQTDAEYFVKVSQEAGGAFGARHAQVIHATRPRAYRWRYILSGRRTHAFWRS